MQKEIPILFSTDIVQAILAGRKTQTRRLVTPQPFIDSIGHICRGGINYGKTVYDKPAFHNFINCCAKWQPGNILWVRESWFNSLVEGYVFKATPPASCQTGEWVKWKPSIHMPKVACRIWLRVKHVGIERLKDITGTDSEREGVQYGVIPDKDGKGSPVFALGKKKGAIHHISKGWENLNDNDKHQALMKAHYAELWCELNGPESWDENPWVWVVSFEVLSTKGKPDTL